MPTPSFLADEDFGDLQPFSLGEEGGNAASPARPASPPPAPQPPARSTTPARPFDPGADAGGFVQADLDTLSPFKLGDEGASTPPGRSARPSSTPSAGTPGDQAAGRGSPMPAFPGNEEFDLAPFSIGDEIPGLFGSSPSDPRARGTRGLGFGDGAINPMDTLSEQPFNPGRRAKQSEFEIQAEPGQEAPLRKFGWLQEQERRKEEKERADRDSGATTSLFQKLAARRREMEAERVKQAPPEPTPSRPAISGEEEILPFEEIERRSTKPRTDILTQPVIGPGREIQVEAFDLSDLGLNQELDDEAFSQSLEETLPTASKALEHGQDLSQISAEPPEVGPAFDIEPFNLDGISAEMLSPEKMTAPEPTFQATPPEPTFQATPTVEPAFHLPTIEPAFEPPAEEDLKFPDFEGFTPPEEHETVPEPFNAAEEMVAFQPFDFPAIAEPEKSAFDLETPATFELTPFGATKPEEKPEEPAFDFFGTSKPEEKPEEPAFDFFGTTLPEEKPAEPAFDFFGTTLPEEKPEKSAFDFFGTAQPEEKPEKPTFDFGLNLPGKESELPAFDFGTPKVEEPTFKPSVKPELEKPLVSPPPVKQVPPPLKEPTLKPFTSPLAEQKPAKLESTPTRPVSVGNGSVEQKTPSPPTQTGYTPRLAPTTGGVENNLQLANSFYEQKEYNQSINHFNAAIKLADSTSLDAIAVRLVHILAQPGANPRYHRLLGDVYKKQGQFQAALSEYSRALTTAAKK